MDQFSQSSPAGQMMGRKVGGKMTVGQYFSYQKKYYMWLVVAAVVVGALSLIPGLYITMGFVGWLVSLYGVFVLGMFGYKMAKEKKGELKEALIGGAILGGVVGVINAIFGAIAGVIFFNTVTAGFGVFGAYGSAATGGVIIGSILGIVWGAVGGLVVSLIGFAIGGGFSKPTGAAR